MQAMCHRFPEKQACAKTCCVVTFGLVLGAWVKMRMERRQSRVYRRDRFRCDDKAVQKGEDPQLRVLSLNFLMPYHRKSNQ